MGDGTNTLAVPAYKYIDFGVQDPENLKTHAGRSTKSQPVWVNNSGMTLTIEEIRCSSDTDNYTFLLFKSSSLTDIGTTNDTQIDSVACTSNGTGHYYISITSGFDSSTIETGKYLIFEHSSGTAESIQVHIKARYQGGT